MHSPALDGSLIRTDMWEDRYLRPSPMGWGYFLQGHLNVAGYTSICELGSIKGFQHLQEQCGPLPVSFPPASVWQRRPEHPEKLAPLNFRRCNSEPSRLYLREGGEPYRVGERFRNPDYGSSLRHLAAHGADGFYQGEMAERMSRDIKTHGGLPGARADSERRCPSLVRRVRDRVRADAALRPYADRHPQHHGDFQG